MFDVDKAGDIAVGGDCVQHAVLGHLIMLGAKRLIHCMDVGTNMTWEIKMFKTVSSQNILICLLKFVPIYLILIILRRINMYK